MLIRFKKNDGTEYPQWEEKRLGAVLKERNQKNCKDGTYEHVSLTKEGVVPKTDRYNRDFLVRNEDKEYKITKLNDICYNPANLKFGVICRNKYGNGIFSPIYITFEIDNAVNPIYMEYFLTRADFINYALKYQQGTVYERMAVSPTDLLSISTKLPSLEEQQKIADFLSIVDQKIESQKAIVADYEDLKKGTMQKIFNQEIRFKDDDENEFPVWEEKRLLDILKQSITDGPHETPNIVEKGIPFISVDAIVDNRIDFSRKRGYITLEYNELCNKKYSPKREDVYLVKSGSTVGKVAIVETDDVFNIWSPLAAMRVDKNNSAYFLYYLLQTENIQKQIRIKSFGGTQPNLSMRVLERFVLNIPCLEEQKKIADYLSALDRKIEAEKKILADLEELKKGLLQAIFNN